MDRIKQQQKESLRAGAGGQSNVPSSTPVSPEMVQAIQQVLEEFAQSPYAMEMCSESQVPLTDRGTAYGLFKELRMQGTTLVVHLTRPAEDMATKIFDRLRKLFGERMRGQVTQLQYEIKQPPSTKTYTVI